MPSPPEVGDRGSEIGEIEIDREGVTKQSSDGDCHVGVAGKVTVNLDRVKKHADPGARSTVGLWIGKKLIDKRRDPIRHARLFDEAAEEKHQCGAHVDLCPSRPGFGLRKKMHRSNDRTRHEGREEADKKGEIEKAAFRADMPAINLDRIANRLKGVKADSVRKNDPEGMERRLEPNRGKKLLGRADEEIQIFEDAKCSEIGGKTNE